MGKYDVADRLFFADRERFAELINVELYHGEKVLLPENLTLIKRKYPSISGTQAEKERDVLMHDTSQNICYGTEIETEFDYSMPERVMAYDICEYEYQMKEIHKRHTRRKDYGSYREKKSRMKRNDYLIPAVTAVLYLGGGHWEGRRKMSQMFHLPVKVKKLLGKNLHDYDFPLIEADYVNPEAYQTDLREFFLAMQCRKDKCSLKELLQTERFQHLMPETEQVIALHLHMDGLIEKMEKEGVSMCKAIRDWLEEERTEGKKEGIEEGKKEGIEEGKIEGKREEKILIIRRMEAVKNLVSMRK